MHIVRGDFHRHTELSWDGGGTNDGNLQDFYRYMIDAAGMDFGASTDHQGGAWPYWWWYTQKMTDMYHVPGAYVADLRLRAQRALSQRASQYVLRQALGIARHAVLPEGRRGGRLQTSRSVGPQGDEPGVGSGELAANDTKMLYEEIRGRNGIAIPHTSSTRMGTDWRDNDPKLEPVVEIYQGARTNSEAARRAASPPIPRRTPASTNAGRLPAEGHGRRTPGRKGYKLGIITSSDHGSTHISYALVYTDDPTRQGVLDAIRKRHTYGAIDNIILDVHMGEHFMGDEFPLSAAEPLKVKIRGTGAIAKVDVIKDSKVIYSTTPKQAECGIRVYGQGQRGRTALLLRPGAAGRSDAGLVQPDVHQLQVGVARETEYNPPRIFRHGSRNRRICRHRRPPGRGNQ